MTPVAHRSHRRLLGARPLALAICLAAVSGCASSSLTQGPSDTLRAYSRALEDKRVEDAYRLLSDEARRSVSLEAFRRMVLESPEDVMEVARALARPASDPSVRATVTMPNGEELLMVFEDGRWRIDAAAIDLYGQSTPRQALVGFLRALERKRYDVILRYVPDAEREGVEPSPSATALAAAGGAPTPGGGPTDPVGAPAPASGGPAAPATPPIPPKVSDGPLAHAADGGELTAEELREQWEGPQKDEMLRIAQALKAALPSATIEETGDVASMSYGSGGTISLIRERGAWKIRDF